MNKSITIIGKGKSILEIDLTKIDTEILTINYPSVNIKYDFMCAFDFKPPKKTDIYIKDYILQKEPCFNKKDKTRLGFFNYTVTSAVNWCYKQNYKNIYLIGIDHDKGTYIEPGVIEFIEKFKDKCNIYQCYKSDLWNLPYSDKFSK